MSFARYFLATLTALALVCVAGFSYAQAQDKKKPAPAKQAAPPKNSKPSAKKAVNKNSADSKTADKKKAPAPKEEADRLVHYLLPKVVETLENGREFSPFGGYLRDDGQMVVVPPYSGNETRSSKELLDRMLNISLQGKVLEEKAKATAAVFDSRVVPPGQSQKTDAIAFYVDHRDSYSVNVYVPYSVDTNNKITTGKVFTTWGSNRVYFPKTKAKP